MTKVRRPYSRVYWEALDDPKFATVWDDDRALAAWLRLLVAADMAWPASASLYHGVNRAALAKLCDVHLVDMQAAGRYRIHGLDKERAARARQASDAAAARWDDDEPPHPAGNADGMRPHPTSNPGRMPSQDEPSKSKDEQSKDEQSTDTARAFVDDGTEFPVLSWLTQQGVTIPPNGNGFHRRIVLLVERFGAEKVRQAMAGAMAAGARGDRAIVFGAEGLLDPVPNGKPKPEVVGKGGVSAEDAERAFGIVR